MVERLFRILKVTGSIPVISKIDLTLAIAQLVERWTVVGH